MSRPIPVEEMVRLFKAHHQSSHIFKIDNFSLLRKYQIEDCESSVFEIGGCKWKLILYPNGNDKDNGNHHISLYLEIQDSGSLSLNWPVKVNLTLFILNQYRRFWKAEEGPRVFNAWNIKQGTARLIHLDTLYDSSQGFLVGNCALLGVKLMGLRGAKVGTAECFTLIEKPPNNKVTRKMMKFSTYRQHNYHHTDDFVMGNRKWKIVVCPRGCKEGLGNSLSVFLWGAGYVDSTPRSKTYAKFKLQVLDQILGRTVDYNASRWFPVNSIVDGPMRFIPLQDLHNPSKGFLVNDTLHLRVEFDVISMTKYC